MNFEFRTGAAPFSEAQLFSYTEFLRKADLRNEGDADVTVLAYEGDTLVACGSRSKKLLKQIAVLPAAEGSGACAAVVSELMKDAYGNGITKLFLNTKPKYRALFSSLSFYPLAQTQDMLLMENSRSGLTRFLDAIGPQAGQVGAIVCNCSPITNGHLYLMREAAKVCDTVLVFVVAEENGPFPAADRLRLVREATQDIPNLSIHSGGDYLVSYSTFPAYFIRDEQKAERARGELDLTLFGKRIAPALHISRRFVGSEPFSPLTRQYNLQMQRILPEYGIQVTELARYKGISASAVRSAISNGRFDDIRALVPPCVYAYCTRHFRTDA